MPILPENRARYPRFWPRLSKHIRFVRARGRCECRGECGRDHRGRCDRTNDHDRVVLTVAHLDHQPENCRFSNLRAMCQGCHNRYDRAHRNETRRRRSPQLEIGGIA